MTAPAGTAAATEAYPLPRRVLDVFVAPGRLFASFREQAPWVGPLLIAAAVAVLLVVATPQELFVEQARETIRRAGDAAAQMPDAETIAAWARVGGIVSVALIIPITAFAVAGVMTLVFSVVGGGAAGYRQYLAVVTHAMLITALGGVVTFVVQLMLGDLGARLSLALLVPGPGGAGFGYRLLGALDVFVLWATVVAALGVSRINPRIGWAAAAATLLGLYVGLAALLATVAPRG